MRHATNRHPAIQLRRFVSRLRQLYMVSPLNPTFYGRNAG